LLTKKFWPPKYVGPKKMLVKNENFGFKKSGPKINFGPKNFWSEKNFGPKKILVRKIFWSEKIFGPKKIFSPRKNLGLKKILV